MASRKNQQPLWYAFPGADEMYSNFAPYAFKGFRFAPISLRETASPPLSAVASSLML